MAALNYPWFTCVLLGFFIFFSCVGTRTTETNIGIQDTEFSPSQVLNELDLVPPPPDRDLKSLAEQYGLGLNKEFMIDEKNAQNRYIGDREQFMVINMSSTESYSVEAELVHMTDNTYWYVDIVSDVDRNLYRSAATQWERIYKNHFAKFEIPRVTILNTKIEGAAGYFSDVDAYPSWVHVNSNQRPILYVDSHTNRPGSNRYMSVLIHEFQHLIHNFMDEGEEAWVDEGLAELMVRNVGYETPLERYFLMKPNTQLNFWPAEISRTPAHYGAASLFFEFVIGEIGGTGSLESLMEEPLDGISGVENWLNKNGTNFHREFGKWAVANYLKSGFDEFSYPSRRLGLRGGIDKLKMGKNTYQVSQYGTRYFESEQKGIEILFKGNGFVGRFETRCVIMCWWSNKGDSIDSSLMLKIDLANTKDPALHFDLWYDIEEGWDYGFLSVSTDEGKIWKTLNAPGTTTFNPVGANYGYGYTGQSGWLTHTVPLMDFVGEEIEIKFQYVTDAAVHLDGMLIQNIRLTDLNMESVDQKLEFDPSGFILVDENLKQKFLLQVIKKLASGTYVVDNVFLGELNQATYSVPRNENLVEIIVIVSGLSGLTQQPANFDLVVSEVPDK